MQILKCPFIDDRSRFGYLLDIHGYRIGAEIGVDWGVFSHQMLSGSKYLTLFSVDPWEPYAEIPNDRVETERSARQLLSEFNGRSFVVKEKSLDASKSGRVPKPLDFAYIDGAHDFENVMLDLRTWWECVRVGGILCGHDFDYSPVQAALFQFFPSDTIVYVIPDVYDGTEGKHPSWYVYKPYKVPHKPYKILRSVIPPSVPKKDAR
jgi:hypothetical protein